MSIPSWPHWAERLLFLLGLLILVHPVLSDRFYFTVDGPAHVYNASLILHRFLGSAPELAAWEWNPVPVPNWLGHALLAVLLVPFKAPEAVKALHLLYLIGLPLSLRALALHRSAAPPWTAHLIFPLVVQVPFSMGFYNFSLALVLFVLVVLQAHRMSIGARRPSAYLLLGLLFALLYLAHLVPFVFALIWIGARAVVPLVGAGRTSSQSDPAFRAHLTGIACAMLPACALFAWYHFGQTPIGTWAPPSTDRWSQLYLSFVVVDLDTETILWGLVASAILLSLGLRLAGQRKGSDSRAWPERFFDPFILLVAFALLATLPNAWASGSGLLTRIAILVHLCALFWLVALPLHGLRAAWVPPVVVAIILCQQAVRQEDRTLKNERLRACYAIASEVRPGSSVAFISFDWLDAHLPELGFADRNVLNLSNYEFINPHFPLRWSDRTMAARGAASDHPLDVLEPWSNVPGVLLLAADNIVVIGTPQNKEQEHALVILRSHIGTSHRLMEENAVCALYSRQ